MIETCNFKFISIYEYMHDFLNMSLENFGIFWVYFRFHKSLTPTLISILMSVRNVDSSLLKSYMNNVLLICVKIVFPFKKSKHVLLVEVCDHWNIF
jgi:hypothetical protein